VLRELGYAVLLASSGQADSRVALAAGDVPEAVRVLRVSYEEGRRLGDRSYHSTTTAYLAEALRRDGQLEQAGRLALEAEEESAPEDVINYAVARGVLALIAASRGELGVALSLAHDAVRYAELTDFPIAQADALVALGGVLRAAGRDTEASAAFARAEALAEAKGDQPVGDRIRAVAAGAAA
jgi:ATP/maltotriose-dependent transcriptional regulator MalT